MPRIQHHFVRRTVRRAQRSLREAWAQRLPTAEELATITLQKVTSAGPRPGSRPQVMLGDESGRRYFFKVAPPAQIAAELLAFRVRRLGRRLHVPSARRRIDLPGVPREVGLLQPELEIVGSLSKRPTEWSAVQCEAMLVEHPWEWLLANLDTHVDQYVLVGELALPVNIDWDHALVDLATTTLTRFNRRTVAVMPVRNMLYADYVAGRIKLDFYGMQVQAHRIAAIPFAEIEGLLRRWAADAEAAPAQHERVVAAMRERHARIADDFDALIDGLRRERFDAFASGRPTWKRLLARAQDGWQGFAVHVLHDRVVRPCLGAYRRALAVRARVAPTRE